MNLWVGLAKQLRQRVENETLEVVHGQMPAVDSVIAGADVQDGLAGLRERDPEEPSG